MPFHPEHARLSPTQIVVAGLLLLLLFVLFVWSFREGRVRTLSEPTPIIAPSAAPTPADPRVAAPAGASGPRP